MAAAVVRPREPGDLDAAAAALIAVHASDGYPVEGVDDPRAWLNPPGLLAAWVDVLDDSVVGHALVTTPKPGDAGVEAWTAQRGAMSWIVVGGRLFVAPDGRGHDLGTRLSQTLTDWAAGEGYDLVGDVMEKDQAALAIYQRIGWRQIGRRCTTPATAPRSRRSCSSTRHRRADPGSVRTFSTGSSAALAGRRRAARCGTAFCLRPGGPRGYARHRQQNAQN